MSDERYSGWTNWDTWVVNLWSGSEQALYDQKWALYKRAAYYKRKEKYDDARFKKGMINFYKRVATFARKKGDEVDNKRVNWNELAKHAKTELKEAIRYKDV